MKSNADVKPDEALTDQSTPPKPPTSPIRDLLKRTEELLAERQALIGKRDAHAVLSGKLEAEEKEMLETSDLTTKGQMKEFKDLQLRREMVPRKLESLQRQDKEILFELREANYALRRELWRLIEKGKKAIRVEIIIALKLFFRGREAELAAWASEWIYETNYGRNISDAESRLKSETFIEGRNVLLVAHELAKIADAIEPLDAWCNPPSRRPGPKTHDELLREELAGIIKNPEAHIMLRVSYKLSREKAEAAVILRKKFIEDHFAGHFRL